MWGSGGNRLVLDMAVQRRLSFAHSRVLVWKSSDQAGQYQGHRDCLELEMRLADATAKLVHTKGWPRLLANRRHPRSISDWQDNIHDQKNVKIFDAGTVHE